MLKRNSNKGFTAAVDNLLCMKNAGTQWAMVSYLKKIKEKKDPGGRLDLPANQHSQSSLILGD